MSEPGLGSSSAPLVEQHDAVLLDLDGVVQLDDQAVPYAVETLADLTRRGLPMTYLTNNASRSASEVAERLAALGVAASANQVLTSAMVAAGVLAQRLPAGAEVLVVGGAGLLDAVADAGLRPVAAATPEVAAVVQGWGPDVDWRLLAEGCVAIRSGATWIATNDDRTLPSPRGPLPGNGSLVAALRTATGLEPEVVGKPQRAVFESAASRTRAAAALMVGDRLDTDIAGARAASLPALLVLTGVSSPRDLLAAAPGSRPTYVGTDLRALLQVHPPVQFIDDEASCDGVVVTADGAVRGADDASADVVAMHGLRAAACLAWRGTLPAQHYDSVLVRLGLQSR